MSWKQNSCSLGNFLWSQIEWTLRNMDQEWPKILQCNMYQVLDSNSVFLSVCICDFLESSAMKSSCIIFLVLFHQFIFRFLNWKWTENRENLPIRFFFCGTWDLSTQPGIETMLCAVGAWSLNHWTAREVSRVLHDSLRFLSVVHLKYTFM